MSYKKTQILLKKSEKIEKSDSVEKSNTRQNKLNIDVEKIHKWIAEYKKNRDSKIKELIVKESMPLVKKIANNLARRSTDPVEDLIQVGCLGLIKAIENFDPSVGAKCTTYFTHLIAGEMKHYCRDRSMLFRAPRELVELNFRINKIIQKLTYEFGREPSDLELAEALELDTNKIQEAQNVERRRNLISLDSAFNSGEDENTLLSTLVDLKSHNQSSLHEVKLVLEKAFASISAESKEIITAIFLKERTQSSYSRENGISQMQTSRRLRYALTELRLYFQKTGLYRLS